jgi:hypothetical protein
MSFVTRDLAIKLSARSEEIDALWAMACPGCDSTGGDKPACQNSQPCQAPSNDPNAWTQAFPGSLALLRREMKNTLGRA